MTAFPVRSADAMQPAVVECYAGARYLERPTAVRWAGSRVAVDQVVREWQTPRERHFQVATRAGFFHLVYRQDEDRWYARLLGERSS